LTPPRAAHSVAAGFVSVGIPVVNHLNGVQAEPDRRLLTGVAVSF
jgi:hypothetical protein